MFLAVGRAFKFMQARKVFRVVEGQVMIGRSSRTIKQDHAPRWSKERLGMKGGGDDRASDKGGEVAGTIEERKDRSDNRMNRWQGGHANITGGNRKARMNKGGWHEGGQKRREEREAWERKSVVRESVNYKRRQRKQDSKETGAETTGKMETRRRVRSEETAATRECSNWEKKGKGVANEKAGGETVMVPNDSEDEVEMFEPDEENRQQCRAKRGRSEEYETEDSQEIREGEDWQGRERGGAREAGSASGMRKRGAGGEFRRKRGRGGRRGQRGRGRGRAGTHREEQAPTYGGKTRRTVGKKVQFAERAYYENTNKDVRRIIQQMEEEAIQGQSDPEMEDCVYLLPDPVIREAA